MQYPYRATKPSHSVLWKLIRCLALLPSLSILVTACINLSRFTACCVYIIYTPIMWKQLNTDCQQLSASMSLHPNLKASEFNWTPLLKGLDVATKVELLLAHRSNSGRMLFQLQPMTHTGTSENWTLVNMAQVRHLTHWAMAAPFRKYVTNT